MSNITSLDVPGTDAEWPALRRKLDRENPGYDS